MVTVSRILMLLFLVSISAQAQNNNILLDVDFMRSMTDNNPKAEKFLTGDPKRSDYFKIFQENYEAKKPSKMLYNKEPLIPKIMHQIWDGEIPPLYQNYLDECKKLHPDWEFKIWDEGEVEELGLIYKDLYDKMRSYVVKADVLRYEILYRFGGVYRDMDVKCLKPIGDLNHMYDLYASLDGPFTLKYTSVNIGLIGSKSNNPLFKNVLDSINRDMDGKIYAWDNDLKYQKDIAPHSFAFLFTYTPFSDEFAKTINVNDKSIALPPSYFMPILYNKFDLMKSRQLGFLDFDVNVHFSSFKPETLMWHNAFKGEIRPSNFSKANGREGRHLVKQILKTLPPLEQKKYNTYQAVHENNSPDKLGWSKTSKIPQVINFVVFSDDELRKLQNNLPTWKMLNGNFEIKIWDQSVIIDHFPELKQFLQGKLDENTRLYIGLKILEKFGGSYAKFKVTPHMPIFELHNKYNFYTGLKPIAKGKRVLLSSKLIGANKSHPIISAVLSKINLSNLSQIDEVLSFEVYKNIYLYGKSIVMPAMYFESADPDNYSFINQIYSFILNRPNSFNRLSEYSIVE
jgi:hypothetical protein